MYITFTILLLFNLHADKDNRSLTIIHFNDVYNIEERDKEPVGGASRFKTACSSIEDPLVLFSGDALSPSNSKSGQVGMTYCIPLPQ